MIALELNNVVKYYGRRRALDGLSLQVPTGTVFGLVGSNGAGKTTALTVSVGMLRRRSGSVDLLSLGPFDPVRHAGRVALLPQDTQLPPQSRVRELLVYYAELQGMTPARARSCADDVVEWVHLSDRADSQIRSLSHGMKRRVLIAQAFLGDPELILLDEPLSGLDPREVANIRNLLRQRRGRQTIVISSHNLHEIERVCDHVAFIENGRTVRQDSMDAVTGLRQILSYRLGEGALPLEQIRAALPSAVLEVAPTDTVDRAAQSLVCRHAGTDGGAPAVNAAVLSALLDAGIDILEVRQGSELESAYLDQERVGSPAAG
jgi:ABC-2 type transport system ATP-binding protein